MLTGNGMMLFAKLKQTVNVRLLSLPVRLYYDSGCCYEVFDCLLQYSNILNISYELRTNMICYYKDSCMIRIVFFFFHFDFKSRLLLFNACI